MRRPARTPRPSWRTTCSGCSTKRGSQRLTSSVRALAGWWRRSSRWRVPSEWRSSSSSAPRRVVRTLLPCRANRAAARRGADPRSGGRSAQVRGERARPRSSGGHRRAHPRPSAADRPALLGMALAGSRGNDVRRLGSTPHAPHPDSRVPRDCGCRRRPGERGASCGAIPDARLELFPGCGHLLFWEQPERFVDVVGEFLS